MEELLGRAEDVADPHIPLLLWWAIEDKAISDRDRVLKLVDSAEAWNRPITRAVVVERLARRYLGEGNPKTTPRVPVSWPWPRRPRSASA